MKKGILHTVFFFLLLIIASTCVLAQEPVIRQGGVFRGNTTQPVNRNGQQGRSDSAREGVERRDYSDDSLRVRVYNLNTVRPTTFDTSIRDYTLRFPIPATHVYLGNDGSATHSLLFSIPARIGWDPGFHSLDVYKIKPENVRFYNTPKPYTELGYMLASGAAQMIEVLHTQNIKPYWNFSFQYRLLSSPGQFANQRNTHNNILLSSWYQSPNKRYNNYFILLQNKLQAGESGGIKTDKDYLNSPIYEKRFTIPTTLGGSSYGGDLFSSTLITGRREREFTIFLRQQYDFGRKDSLVTDTTVIPLFYPRLRFEHNLRFAKYAYSFQDFPSGGRTTNTPDSAYYKNLYGLTVHPTDSLFIQDRWREVSNDFSIYQFPDANNLQQFIKVGAELQLLKAYLQPTDKSYSAVVGHGEYRNRTKNQKWDINALGRLHLVGSYIGDYHAFISLQRLLSQELGTLQVGFENINRSPSFIYNQHSSFYLDSAKNFSKENTAHFFAGYFIPKLGLQLKGDYYVVSNYLYLNGYMRLQQENALFNLLQVSGFKTFRIGRHWNWHSEVYVQQKAGGAEVNVPLVYTRNQFALEGRFFQNLNLSAGLEVRYHTPYKADNYSPVLGQFFYQDTTTISNRPDINAFVHFRIRSAFRAYVRAENLNAANFSGGSLHFTSNNLAAPHYPLPGLIIRLGIYWVFVN